MSDLYHGFSRQAWEMKWPLATQHLGKTMFPTEQVAFPFLLFEGKSNSEKPKDAKKKEEISLRQNLSSTSLALRNLRHLHQEAMRVGSQELNKEPERHISTFLSNSPQVQSYSFDANVNLIGISDEAVTIPNAMHASSVTKLTPYVEFNNTVVILSTIATATKVHLDAHWTSPTSAWPLPSVGEIRPITQGPFYLRYRLMSWDLASEWVKAEAGIAAAVEHIAGTSDRRLKTYMGVLEDDLKQKMELPQQTSTRGDDLVWM